MPYIERPVEKLYYTIGEVAEMLEENASLVRFWASSFPDFIKPARNKKGNRLFTQQDVTNFKFIHHSNGNDELFNLNSDPFELNNILQSESMKLVPLQEELERVLKRKGTPAAEQEGGDTNPDTLKELKTLGYM